MIVIIDNTNKNNNEPKFLNKMTRFLDSLHLDFELVDNLQSLKKLNPSKIKLIILSGSSLMVPNLNKNKHDEKRQMLRTSMTFSKEHDINILGICFGAQYLVKYFKGTLKHLEETFCKKQDVVWNSGKKNKYKFCLNYLPEYMPSILKPIAYMHMNDEKQTKNVVAFKHMNYNIWGFLFHPENDSTGHNLLKSFLHDISIL